MEVYTIVKQWLLPPGGILLLLAVAFLLVRGTLGRMILFTGWSLLLIMSLPALSFPMIALLERLPAIPPDRVTATGAGAIVVLAAGTYTDAPEYGGDTVGANSLQRIRYAAWLQRRTGLPIFVTGGVGEDAPGPLMAAVLGDEYGVPVAVVEDQSRTTWENASNTAPLLRAAGIDHVLLVTQAWHMPRAVAAFERHGIDVTPAPTYFIHRAPDRRDSEDGASRLADWLPQATAFAVSAYAAHELIGQAWYQLRAVLEDPVSPASANAGETAAGAATQRAPAPLPR
jgi:uncharacterized SAM-binding protein YcdF (DUF218 family)